MPHLHIRIKPTHGNGEGGEVTKVHTSAFSYLGHFQPDYTNLGMLVLCNNFLKYAGRNKMQNAAKICGIMPRSHICIKLASGNGESDSLYGKI